MTKVFARWRKKAVLGAAPCKIANVHCATPSSSCWHSVHTMCTADSCTICIRILRVVDNNSKPITALTSVRHRDRAVWFSTLIVCSVGGPLKPPVKQAAIIYKQRTIHISKPSQRQQVGCRSAVQVAANHASQPCLQA